MRTNIFTPHIVDIIIPGCTFFEESSPVKMRQLSKIKIENTSVISKKKTASPNQINEANLRLIQLGKKMGKENKNKTVMTSPVAKTEKTCEKSL